MEDTTERNFKRQPQYQSVIKHIGLNDNIWRGLIFRYTTLSDIDFNERKETQLSPEHKLTGNSYLRKKDVKSLQDEIANILEYPRDSIERKQSAIFVPIIRELDYLSSIEGSKKELLLYSDLKENDSEWFTFYRKTNFEKLQKVPDEVVETFLSQIPEGSNFDGVSIRIIYEPLNSEDNKEFRLMEGLYRKVFARLNVPISFSANL